MSETSQPANRQIARAAGTLMFAFTLSQVAGLVRQILVTRAFGTDPAMDSFSAAISFPNLLFNLLAGGALASAFVPTFTSLLTKDDRPGAWRLASSLMNLVAAILILVSVVSALFAPQIVAVLWPHYTQSLTVQLLRILLITSAIFGISGMVSGILNAHQHFLLPALASSMYWLGWIIGLIFFVPAAGILGLAWGAVLGSCMHLAIQLPDLLRLGGRRYTPTLGLKDASTREVALLMGPRLIGVATIQLNLLINTVIANYLPSGSLAALNYAFPIMTVPLVVIGSGIGFATLPTFSAQVARGELDELKSSITAALRGVLFLSVPATMGLILLGQPLIAFLFQHGKFSLQSTDWVALALALYTVGLVGHATLEVLARAFYALHDTKTPALVGAASMVFNILFSIFLAFVFSRLGWLPLGGLALSTSLAAFLESGTLFILLRKRLNGLQDKQLALGSGAALLGTAAMSMLLGGWLFVMKSASPALTALGGVILGGGTYGLVLAALRVPELKTLLNQVRKGIAKFTRSPKRDSIA